MSYTKPPESIEIGGKAYPVDTDFRTWVEFSSKLRDAKDDKSAFFELIRFARSQKLPVKGDAFEKILEFYACGKQAKAKKDDNKRSNAKKNRRAVDFEQDSDYIYAAFMAQYQIDLHTAQLHWWDFLSLFHALGDEHLICKIMTYRVADTSKMSKELKAHYIKMRNLYSLEKPSGMTLEERNAKWLKKVENIAKEAGADG